MPVTIDKFEYATDLAAQAAYAAFSTNMLSVGNANTDNGASYAGNIYYGKAVAAVSGIISIMKVYAYANTNVRVALYTDDAGKAKTLLNESSVTAVTSGQWNIVAIPPTTVVSGTTYHIGIQCQANNGFGTKSASGHGYQVYNWGAFPATATWVSNPWNVDVGGYLVGAILIYSEATIKEEGDYSMKVVALQTDSLNGTLTRTCSPTLNFTDQDEIKFKIRSSRTGTNLKIGFHDSGGTTTESNIAISSADTWEEKTIDISAVANANKDAIDLITITVTNADAENTIYLDEMLGYVTDEGTGSGGGITNAINVSILTPSGWQKGI